MEHKKLIVKALKHFIRYNKNKEYISIIMGERRDSVSGLCSYVYIHSARSTNLNCESSVQIHNMAQEEFTLLVKKYIKYGHWLSEKYKVTKRRLQVAQMIINKLEKELTHS